MRCQANYEALIHDTQYQYIISDRKISVIKERIKYIDYKEDSLSLYCNKMKFYEYVSKCFNL